MKLNSAARFLFLRHGETDYNVQGIRCGGEIDVSLNQMGLRQAEIIAAVLAREKFPVSWIVASELLRVQQTARIVAGCLGLQIETDAELNERRLGEWNGRLISETESALRAGDTPPGGESAAAFRARILAWFNTWQARLIEPGLIVASKGVGRVLSEVLSGQCVSAGNCELLLFEGRDAAAYTISPFPGIASAGGG
jgi:2,3-bisphosphoglycerate-dependent phosphoglycerate mutase